MTEDTSSCRRSPPDPFSLLRYPTCKLQNIRCTFFSTLHTPVIVLSCKIFTWTVQSCSCYCLLQHRVKEITRKEIGLSEISLGVIQFGEVDPNSDGAGSFAQRHFTQPYRQLLFVLWKAALKSEHRWWVSTLFYKILRIGNIWSRVDFPCRFRTDDKK